ncbi:MAG TPA: VPDSG-CTERM sorting domain-containing protein [Verrucomicrobiae bacterium]|jgi:hypothetical protein
MNLKSITKLTVATALVALVASAQANTILTVGTLTAIPQGSDIQASSAPYVVGEAINGVNYGNFGGQVGGHLEMINQLTPMALGGHKTVIGSGVSGANTDYYRSQNSFTFPTVTATGAIDRVKDGPGFNVVGGFVEFTLPAGYVYLAAKWDGPNGGAMVYDLQGLAAGSIVDLPQTAYGTGMTGYTLFQGDNRVPDGGATVALLGVGLLGLGAMRRKLS